MDHLYSKYYFMHYLVFKLSVLKYGHINTDNIRNDNVKYILAAENKNGNICKTWQQRVTRVKYDSYKYETKGKHVKYDSYRYETKGNMC